MVRSGHIGGLGGIAEFGILSRNLHGGVILLVLVFLILTRQYDCSEPVSRIDSTLIGGTPVNFWTLLRVVEKLNPRAAAKYHGGQGGHAVGVSKQRLAHFVGIKRNVAHKNVVGLGHFMGRLVGGAREDWVGDEKNAAEQ